MGSNLGIETSNGIVLNEKAISKVKRLWEKVPYKFNFWMTNIVSNPGTLRVPLMPVVTGIEDFHNSSTIMEKRVHSNLSTLIDQIHFKDDSINVIYVSNFTNPKQYMPITAWISAHRLSHAFQFTSGSRNLSSLKDYWELERDLTELIIETGEHYHLFNKNSPTRGDRKLDKRLIDVKRNYSAIRTYYDTIRLCDLLITDIGLISCSLFTMRSARENMLHNPIDFVGELIAQYLLTGRVKFNPLSPVIYSRKPGSQIAYDIDDESRIHLDAKWKKLESTIAAQLDPTFKMLKGHVICL
jgi:hypothetical protein